MSQKTITNKTPPNVKGCSTQQEAKKLNSSMLYMVLDWILDLILKTYETLLNNWGNMNMEGILDNTVLILSLWTVITVLWLCKTMFLFLANTC